MDNEPDKVSSKSGEIDRSLLNLLINSRIITAEIMCGMVIHSVQHKLDDTQRRINNLLMTKETRQNKLVYENLHEVRDILRSAARDVSNSLGFVRNGYGVADANLEAHSEITNIVNLWQDFFNGHGCKLVPRCKAQRTVVRTTTAGFQEILSALLVNSVEAHSHKVSIYTQNAANLQLSEICYFENALCVVVEDDGVGIQADTEEIFAPTFTSKPSKNGVGLGLFIARSLARQVGGELSCNDQSSRRGASFTLALPVTLE